MSPLLVWLNFFAYFASACVVSLWILQQTDTSRYKLASLVDLAWILRNLTIRLLKYMYLFLYMTVKTYLSFCCFFSIIRKSLVTLYTTKDIWGISGGQSTGVWLCVLHCQGTGHSQRCQYCKYSCALYLSSWTLIFALT